MREPTERLAELYHQINQCTTAVKSIRNRQSELQEALSSTLCFCTELITEATVLKLRIDKQKEHND